MYQQGACCITKAVEAVDWRRYGLEQRGGNGIPFGPAIIIVHVASTKVPFTSEAKEAIASIPAIQNEIEIALRTCGRTLKTHLNKKETKIRTKEKFDIVQVILPLIAQKSAKIVDKPVPSLSGTITKIMNVVWIDDDVTYRARAATRSGSPSTTTPRTGRSSTSTWCCPRGRSTTRGWPYSPRMPGRTERRPGS